MGKEISLSTTGEKIRKSTPYDFIGITDHAEYLGILPSITTPGGELYDTEAASGANKSSGLNKARPRMHSASVSTGAPRPSGC
jgi:hypothetical protein